MIKKPPFAKNIFAVALTLLVIGLASYIAADRYVYLKVKRELHSFFDCSLDQFLNGSVFQIRQGTTLSDTEKLKHQEIIHWPLRPAYGFNNNLTEHPVRYLYNFFGKGKETLQGYGQVVHAHIPANPNIGGPTRVWFVVSAGPSGAEVDIDETTEADGVHRYEIASQPYHITNGIYSVGYLYSDTNGVKAGDTPLVGIKP